MGVDLTLLPLEADHPAEGDKPAFQYSHSMLNIWRSQALWPKIENLTQERVSAGFTSFMGRAADGEHGYGKTTKDAYGEPIMWAAAGDLAKLAKSLQASDNPQNRAVWAYLSALQPETKVALYWH